MEKRKHSWQINKDVFNFVVFRSWASDYSLRFDDTGIFKILGKILSEQCLRSSYWFDSHLCLLRDSFAPTPTYQTIFALLWPTTILWYCGYLSFSTSLIGRVKCFTREKIIVNQNDSQYGDIHPFFVFKRRFVERKDSGLSELCILVIF